MLRSIIYQIVIRQRRLLELVRKARALQGPQLFHQLSGLWELLLDIIKAETQIPTIIVIDAIDECDKSTQLTLVSRITKLMKAAEDSPIKFFITARPQISASYGIPNDATVYHRLDLEDFQTEIGQDVLLVIQQRLDLLVQRNSCTDDLRVQLEGSLAPRAGKTFLWASLVLLSLESKSFLMPSDLIALNRLPTTAVKLYRELLENIPTTNRKAAGELLRILVCSDKPLKINEINLLLDYYLEPKAEREHPVYTNDTVKRQLYPLVQISHGALTLIHPSIGDFLLGVETSDEIPEDLSKAFGVDLSRDSLKISKACMRYLLSDPFTSDIFSAPSSSDDTDSPSVRNLTEDSSDGFDFGGFDGEMFAEEGKGDEEICRMIAREYHLYDYASRFWTQLLDHDEETYLDSEFQDMAVSLFDLSETHTGNWLRYFWEVTAPGDVYPESSTPISLASYFGHSATVRHLSEEEQPEREIGLSVYWASRQGNASCLRILLQSYADRIIRRPSICSLGRLSPLAVAAQYGHQECVEVILERNIFDINAKNDSGQTALSLAVTHGHTEIVSMLLKETEVDLNISDHGGSTPLFWTIASNSLSILSMLLKDKRVDVLHLDNHGRNPLSWAAEEGQTTLAEKMIQDRRMDLNNRDRNGKTPLLWAVQNVRFPIVKLLIEKGRVDTSARDKHGRTAISWAAERNDKRMMPFLIKTCPKEVDSPDDQGWAPLAWSLNTPGYLNNTLALFQSGRVNINLKDSTSRTPLSFAVGWGYLEIAKAFLRFPGVDPNCVDSAGNTPIFDAVRDSNLDMIKVLIDAKGVDINFRNKNGKTPLAVALAEKKLDIVALLLSAEGIEKDHPV
ncbi:hypothetical protein Dda_3452 [Drechslerella dactyloides]|uniref:protein S-acyltransferase n=1 Tax=Drechslerella dactyloides TaxID=74499 RepID=A0AAD6J1K4_DREDA|nr:hypothetical protein Dda_3452 [Drechslerella dactyloides]